MSKKFSRLPSTVVPSHYVIKLKPDLVKHTFEGEVSITAKVNESVTEVLCNAANLGIQKCSVTCGDNIIQEAKVSLDKEQETVKMTCKSPLVPGSATINMNFTGVLNDKMRGFYRTKYTVEGEDRFAAVTQFEATDARQAFPCWDEPAVKATFDIIIVAPKDRVVLSNMPEIDCQDDASESSFKVVKFGTSPIMSTYLVAITVGEFDYIEDKSEEGILCRVYSLLGKKEQGRFALECAVKSLTFYSKFFNVPYPLEKYDMVAVPDHIVAMENWGLVLYRESCILVDPANSSQSSKQYVAIVVNHETAHQWFGNLVTMEWWTHLWLNEGFAQFMENLTTDVLYPEYKIWEQFVPGSLLEALELDALKSSHPIEVEVGHPSEVDEIFDNITYNKGASVIRMLYNWIGDEAFRKGMHIYLSKYSYKNALTPQLWAELEAASGLPVESVMKTWTEQMGFPCISVSSQQEGADRVLSLRQTKFVGDGSEGGGARWHVPISIISSAAPNSPVKVMMDREEEVTTVRLPGVSSGDWVKLNPGVVGYYRVDYSDTEDLGKLCEAVSSKALVSVDRLNILDDLFSLIAAGKAKTVDGLRLLKSYKAEDSYIVWNNIAQQLAKISIIIADKELHDTWTQFKLDLFSDIKSKVTWDPQEGEGHLDTLLRSLVLSQLGQAGDTEVRAEAKRRFDAHVTGVTQINPDIRAAVYKTVASMGQEEDFNTMVKLHNEAELLEEKCRIQRSGLSCFQSKTLLTKALEMAVSEHVRAQDSVHFMSSVAARRLGRDLTWQFFKDKFVILNERYSSGFMLSRLVKSSTCDLLGEERAREVETFFTENPMPGSERNVAQSVEKIRLNTAWLERDGQNIENFFKNS